MCRPPLRVQHFHLQAGYPHIFAKARSEVESEPLAAVQEFRLPGLVTITPLVTTSGQVLGRLVSAF